MKTGGRNATMMGEDMFDYLSSENYIFATNRLFNYRFRDRDCLLNGNCVLPRRNRPVAFSDASFYIGVIGVPAIAAIVGFWVVGLFYVHDWRTERTKRRYSQEVELTLEL
jgi:hypothetical protein